MKNLFRRRSEEKNDDEEDELYQFISKVKPLVDVFRPTADFFQTFGGWRPPMDVVVKDLVISFKKVFKVLSFFFLGNS